MPHIFIEHSANLSARIDLGDLTHTVHQAALATGVFPEGGIRTRRVPREGYLIADGHSDNAFVHLVLRIGSGRDLDTRQRAANAVFEALCEFLEPDMASHPLGVSLEIQEIVPETSHKKSNLHAYVKRRQETNHE